MTLYSSSFFSHWYQEQIIINNLSGNSFQNEPNKNEGKYGWWFG